MCNVMVVVGEGLVSRSDRKCLCRWNSNVDTYRKQPSLQLCVSVFICVLVISSSSLLLYVINSEEAIY